MTACRSTESRFVDVAIAVNSWGEALRLPRELLVATTGMPYLCHVCESS